MRLGSEGEETATVRGGALREERDRLLQVLGLSAFAIAQPVLDVMGRSPETFVFRGAGTGDLLLFAIGLVLLPAVGLFALGVWTRFLGPRVRAGAHVATLLALATIIGMQVLKKTTSMRGAPLATAAIVVGSLAALLFVRSRVARTWLRYSALAPPAFVGFFLLVAPVSKLVLPTPQAAAATNVTNPVPIVMVVFDQLPLATLLDRSGMINSDLFPNFAELASRSTWYRNYTVTEPHTQYSIPTILTGTVVEDRSKEAFAADYPNNLFTMVRGSHRLVVREPVYRLCPPGLCSGSHLRDNLQARGGRRALIRDAVTVWQDLSLPGEVARDVTAQFVEEGSSEQASEQEAESPGSRSASGDEEDVHRPRSFQAFLEAITDGEQPTLGYFHHMLPHIPWRFYPSGAEYQRLSGDKDDIPAIRRGRPWSWVPDEWPVLLARQRHLLQVQYVDRLLGDLIEHLEDAGTYDESLLIVTSDHGISFQPGQSRGPTQENMHEIYWVPLLVKQPHQREGEVDDRNLLATDLLPTIAEVLGMTIPWETDGASMLDLATDAGPVKSIFRRWESRVPWPPETLVMAQSAAQRRMMSAVFPSVGSCRREPICPYVVGPGASVVGKPVTTMSVGAPSGLSASLELPVALDVDGAEISLLPGLVWGALAGRDVSDDTQVAVVANGRLAGVSDTWTQDGVPGWFGVLVPEFFLRTGSNEIRLFEVKGRALHPISLQ